MLRHSPFGVALLFAVSVVFPATVRAHELKELKVIAKTSDRTGFQNMGPIALMADTLVIRNAEELVAASKKPKSAKNKEVQKEMEGILARFLKVDAIDWSKQTVVVVMTNESVSLKSDGKGAIVTYEPMRPMRVAGYPFVVFLTERVEGEVKFVQKK